MSPKGDSKSAWQVDYRDNFGNRRSKQFARKRDAEAWLTNTAWQVSQGTHTPDSQSIRVKEATKLWIGKAESDELEVSTLHQYRGLAKNHILPFLGDQKLSRLTRPMVEAYRDTLLETRSRAMSGKAVKALSSILSEAARRGLVAQNVAHGVKVDRKSRNKSQVEIPSRDELRSLIEAASDDERPFILTAIFTGLRASELRGLRWSDIDFDAATLSVNQRADNFGQIGSPKSEAGYRTIPIPSSLISDLRRWKLRAIPSRLDLVFPSRAGTPISYQNLLRRMFKPLLNRAGLESRYGLHHLRHAAASAWIDQKIDLKRLQVWMGHSSIQMTLDTYGHLIKDAEKDAEIAEAAQCLLMG